jgi:hypothetical protein
MNISLQRHIQITFKMPPAAFADLSLTVRAIVIAFRVFYNMGWIEMSPKLGIQPDTARKFFLRTREIAGGSMDLWDLLLHAPAHAHAHRATIIEPGSAESHEIQEAVLNRKHWGRKDAANYTLTHSDRPPLKEKTIRNICLDLQHAAADPDSPKRIKRLRCPRIEYTYNLEKVAGITIEEAAEQEWQIDADCVLIGVHEYALGFGGAGPELISALEMEGYLRRRSKRSA